MNCICSQRELKDALIAASKALPAKAQTPILNGIYITAKNDQLEIQATDFSLGVIAKISAEIENEGTIVVNGKNITEIISKLDGDIVTISTEEGAKSANFKSEAAAFSLYTMDAEEFPKVNVQEFDHSFFIKNNVLRKLIARSTFAASNDDSRPIFQGCSVTIENSAITFVATNTHRLVVVKAEIEDDIPGENKFIIPAKTLNDLMWIINSAREDNGVKVEFSDKHIAFTVNDVFVTCRLIDGQFPPHEKVIPASCETYATLDIGEFRSAINRVEIISKQTEYNTVRLAFSNEGLELSSDSYDTGKVIEHVNAAVEGSNVEIAFNLKYIQDLLKISGGGDEVRIGMNDKLSPADFRLVDDEDFIYIVTPVRT
mgnify:CR=1 FL=1